MKCAWPADEAYPGVQLQATRRWRKEWGAVVGTWACRRTDGRPSRCRLYETTKAEATELGDQVGVTRQVGRRL
jgi:hypothetical protein